MTQLFPDLYGNAKPVNRSAPSFTEYMGSAFRLENDVVNFYDYMTRDTFRPDTSYDYKRDFTAQGLPLDWEARLSESVSAEDFSFRLAKIQKEERDKATLAAAGWYGTFAAMGAGILSPTSLLPIAGAASRGRVAIGEAFALAGVGATVSETALFLNQETRTVGESAASIGLNTVLGGVMGVGFLSLQGKLRAKIVADFPLNTRKTQIQSIDPVTGATVKQDFLTSEPDFTAAVQAARSPHVVRDLPATERAVVEPEVRVGYSRLYFSGGAVVDAGDITATSNRAIAEEADPTAPLTYIDLPSSDVRLTAKPTQGLPSDVSVKLSPEEIAQLKEIYRGQSADEITKEGLLKVGPDGRLEPYANVTDEAVPQSRPAAEATQGVSAQVAPSRYVNTTGAQRPKNRFARAAYDAAAKLNPLTRTSINRVSPKTRDNAMRLGSSGNRQANLDTMEPSAMGGNVDARIRLHDRALVNFFSVMDDAYYLHVFGKDAAKSWLRNSKVQQIRSAVFGPPAGKMTYAQFSEAVYDGLTTGKVESPEIKMGVEGLRNFFRYYNDMHKAYMKELGTDSPMYKEMTEEDFEEGVIAYAHQIWDSAKIKQNSSEFLREFAERAEAQLNDQFAEALKKHKAKVADLEIELAFAKLDPDGMQGVYDELQNEIDAYADMPEYSSVREEAAEIRKASRDEGWSKEQLKAALKDLEDNASQAYKDIKAAREKVQKKARRFRKLGGNDLAELEAARAKLVAEEEAVYTRLERMADKVSVLKIDAEKTGASTVANWRKAAKELATGIAEMEKRNAQMAKLLASKRANVVSRARVDKQLAAATAKVEALKERLAVVEGKNVADEVGVRETLLIKNELLKDTRDALRGRYARIEQLDEQVEGLTQATEETLSREAKIAQIDNELTTRELDFERRWSDNGAVWDSPETPNFKERALELATDFQKKLVGNGEMRPAGMAILGAERGPQLRRLLKLPYDTKKKWLVRDTETVARSFDRQMAPDLELWRATGSVNGRAMFEDLASDIQELQLRIARATHVRLPKDWGIKARALAPRVRDAIAGPDEGHDFFLGTDDFADGPTAGYEILTPKLREQISEFIDVQHTKLAEDLGVMVQRLRRQRGAPKDSSSILWRSGRTIKDMQVMSMMGKVLPSSLSDIARPVVRYGIAKTFKKAWGPMLTGMKNAANSTSYRVHNKEMNKRLAIAVDTVTHSRAAALLDLAYDKASGYTVGERAVRFGANKMGLIALFDLWTDAMKNVSAAVVHSTMAEYTPKVADYIMSQMVAGKAIEPSGELREMLVYLRRLGLRDMDIVRIGQQMQKPGAMETFRDGARLPNLDQWDDLAAYRAYGGAVQTEVNDLIVTPGLDRPSWTDENMAYSMLAQFKSYTFTATNRVVMSGLQGNDPYIMQGSALAVALGALSYYTNAYVSGDKAWDKAMARDWEGVMYEAIDRSGLLGALSLGTMIGEQLPLTDQMAIFGGEDQKFRRPSGLFGTILGPTAGTMEKLADILTNMDDPAQKERLLNRFQSMLPYNNVFLPTVI